MGEPKGVIIIPIGFNPSDNIRAVTVDANDYLQTVLETGLTGGGMGEPKGPIAVLCGINPDGKLRSVELDANDNILMTLLGGAANQILVSNGTKFAAETLANLIEAALLTADGDILIREGGVAKRLAKPAVGQILGESSQIPAWITKPTTAYTEGARAYSTTEQTIPNTTQTSITLPLEVYDTDGIHDLVTNNSRMTCRTAGYYMMVGCIRMRANGTGLRGFYIYLNGSLLIAHSIDLTPSATDPTLKDVITIRELAVDDYVELVIWHNAGGDLNTRIGTGFAPVLSIQRIG